MHQAALAAYNSKDHTHFPHESALIIQGNLGLGVGSGRT
jgi:hypothetical protein